MRSRKCQLGVACSRETQRGREAHSARWTQSDGGLRRRCGGEGGDGEEGTERAEAQAGRAHGAGGEGFHLGLSRQFLPAHTQREKQAGELEDDVRRVCAVCPGAMAAEVGRASGKGNPTPPTPPPAQQTHTLLNQLWLHSPQSFALHASQEPHRAVFADFAAAVLCGFAGPATPSSSSVGSTTCACALACSSALRLSCFAGDRPLCLESTVCQNSSNSRSVISWLHSRLRDSILASPPRVDGSERVRLSARPKE